MLTQAKDEAAKSPLTKNLPDVGARFKAWEESWRVLDGHEPTVRAAQARAYVPSLLELSKGAAAEDPLERWEALRQMGQHVTVESIDPLLHAFRVGRNPLVRRRAFEALEGLTRALPKKVAQYELNARLLALKGEAGSSELHLAMAALLDLLGSSADAALEYRRGFDQEAPDPVVLHRWMEVRRDGGQRFSAAVAARQLAVWAQGLASGMDLKGEGTLSLGTARLLCAAAVEAQAAREVIRSMVGTAVEFPEDLKEFAKVADAAASLTRAKLEDAELALQTSSPGVRLCWDQSLTEKLAKGETARLSALGALQKKAPKAARLLLLRAAGHDPSPTVRAKVQELAAVSRD
jgi:hypothetical protein